SFPYPSDTPPARPGPPIGPLARRNLCSVRRSWALVILRHRPGPAPKCPARPASLRTIPWRSTAATHKGSWSKGLGLGAPCVAQKVAALHEKLLRCSRGVCLLQRSQTAPAHPSSPSRNALGAPFPDSH